MRLTAITICVNYSDFLAWTLPHNKPHFDRWIIVSDTKDQLTHNLCSFYNVELIKTDVFYQDQGFNKYAGINEALKKVGNDQWVLFLDADIVLPPTTKRVLKELQLSKDSIYGIDRLDVKGLEEWVKFINYPRTTIDNWLLTPSSLELGARIVHIYGGQGDNGMFTGWKPLGFFQLCNKSQFSIYPDNCQGADHCDIEFTNNWPRAKRVLIPEIIGLHLVSVDAGWGSNWKSRKTSPFLFNEQKQYSNE
jgi:glycosyltransferase involved in cell wall biosynthesis